MGKCSIKDSFIRIRNGEALVYGMNISPYEKGNIFNKDPLRKRELLMHKIEINRLFGKIKQKGTALHPSGKKGTHTLTAHLGNLTTTIPITVTD
jgi:SsrA-binding protein